MAAQDLADRPECIPRFSRPTTVSLLGKCDDVLPEVRIPSELKKILQLLASLEDKPLGTYVREQLEHHAILQQRRLNRIVDKFGGVVEGTNVAP